MPSENQNEQSLEKSALSLGDLRPQKGATKKRLRVGRGRASGAGKTCNRGHNGEGQRSGRSRKRGFEGGQMPGYRQMPKMHFIKALTKRRNWLELNIGDLEQILLPEEDTVTYALLISGGLMKNRHDGVRLLGNGEITRKINIEAHYVTPSAKNKINAVGGEIKLIAPAVAAVTKD
ncbi:MAG: 50S ribosomal protein L15 [Cyanobacteria bacterium P01_H01_bin.74]